MAASLLHRAIVGTMPFIPRALIWRFSRRYIAGTQLTDAYNAVRKLNALGVSGTIDVLGEDVESPNQVADALRLYHDALDGIRENRLRCGISVKLSELGLRFDPDGCRAAMRQLAADTEQHGNFVRIDMEDSSVTSETLDIYRDLRHDHENIGAVIQSCLRRSRDDIADLVANGPTDIRLCKGIYVEPEDIAFQEADEIRDSFSSLLDQLFEGGARVGIATHDPILVDRALASIRRYGVDKDRYEFQMLLGVTKRLRQRLVDDGHRMRVYVPFGELWYNYSLRRLRENPNIAGHIVRNLFTRK